MIADFDLIYQIDEQIKKSLLEYVPRIFAYSFKERMAVARSYTLSGSLAESCFSSSLFSFDKRFDDNIQKSVDIDIALQIMDLSKKYKRCIVNEEKKGFATLLQKGEDCFCEECLKKWALKKTPKSKNLRDDILDEDGYLIPYKIKQVMYEKNNNPRFFNGERSNRLCRLFAILLHQPPENVKSQSHRLNITKATFRMSCCSWGKTGIVSLNRYYVNNKTTMEISIYW